MMASKEIQERIDRDRARALRWFEADHLPPHLRGLVSQFHPAAEAIAGLLGTSDQAAVALQKLIEAKDAAVRAMIDALPEAMPPRGQRAKGGDGDDD